MLDVSMTGSGGVLLTVGAPLVVCGVAGWTGFTS
jgi:hypothetical protein